MANRSRAVAVDRQFPADRVVQIGIPAQQYRMRSDPGESSRHQIRVTVCHSDHVGRLGQQFRVQRPASVRCHVRPKLLRGDDGWCGRCITGVRSHSRGADHVPTGGQVRKITAKSVRKCPFAQSLGKRASACVPRADEQYGPYRPGRVRRSRRLVRHRFVPARVLPALYGFGCQPTSGQAHPTVKPSCPADQESCSRCAGRGDRTQHNVRVIRLRSNRLGTTPTKFRSLLPLRPIYSILRECRHSRSYPVCRGVPRPGVVVTLS